MNAECKPKERIREKHLQGEIETLRIAIDGLNYRLIFELWRFDDVSQDFIFSQSEEDGGHGLWIQLWFNATTSI